MGFQRLTRDQLDRAYQLQSGEQWRDCELCGSRFRTKRSHARYCSPECRQRAYRENNLLTTLTLNLDIKSAMVLRGIAEANGVSRQHIVQSLIHQLVEQATDPPDRAVRR